MASATLAANEAAWSGSGAMEKKIGRTAVASAVTLVLLSVSSMTRWFAAAQTVLRNAAAG